MGPFSPPPSPPPSHLSKLRKFLAVAPAPYTPVSAIILHCESLRPEGDDHRHFMAKLRKSPNQCGPYAHCSKDKAIGGVFAQCGHRAGTAPIVTVFIPGAPLKNTHLQVMINSKL